MDVYFQGFGSVIQTVINLIFLLSLNTITTQCCQIKTKLTIKFPMVTKINK